MEELWYNMATEEKTMPVIVPVRDLKDTNKISELCNRERRPIFVTKNGYGDMVVMSMEAYDELVSTAVIDSAIAIAEAEYEKSGITHNARDELPKLRRKYLG